MSALQAEHVAVFMVLDCIAAGDISRALVWLRLANEAHEAWHAPGCSA